jgi:hypothetical protein
MTETSADDETQTGLGPTDETDTAICSTQLPDELAWSAEEPDTDPLPAGDRRSWTIPTLALVSALVGAATVAVVALTSVLLHRPAPAPTVAAPPPASTTTTVAPSPPPPPITVTSTAPPPPPITKTTTAPPPPQSAPDPPMSVYDRAFLERLRPYATISDPYTLISWAHRSCELFRTGERTKQVNQQIQAESGLDYDTILYLTSEAISSYPHCY